MKIIVCLDDKNGMMFANRRQSMDRLLRQDLLKMTQGSNLWMSPYSASQFAEEASNILVDPDFLRKAEAEDWCFVEDAQLDQAEGIAKIAIYRWNRVYPSDKKFPIDRFCCDWKLESTKDFPGSSHERITLEVYVP